MFEAFPCDYDVDGGNSDTVKDKAKRTPRRLTIRIMKTPVTERTIS